MLKMQQLVYYILGYIFVEGLLRELDLEFSFFYSMYFNLKESEGEKNT